VQAAELMFPQLSQKRRGIKSVIMHIMTMFMLTIIMMIMMMIMIMMMMIIIIKHFLLLLLLLSIFV